MMELFPLVVLFEEISKFLPIVALICCYSSTIIKADVSDVKTPNYFKKYKYLFHFPPKDNFIGAMHSGTMTCISCSGD